MSKHTLPARTAALLTSLVLASLILSGCLPLFPADKGGEVQPSDTPVPTRTPRPISTSTLTPTPAFLVPLADLQGAQVIFWHPWTGALGDRINQFVDSFNQANEWGIHVQVKQPGSSSVLEQQLVTAAGTDIYPQLVIAPSEDLQNWYDQGNRVVVLNDYINDPTWGLDEQQRADFPLVFWQQDQTDGYQLGIPFQRSAPVIYYNLTWAAELGFSQPPASTADLETQACAAAQANNSDSGRDNDGTGGWIVDTDGLDIYAWIKAFGLDSALKGDPPTITLEQPATRQAFEYLRGLVDAGCAWSARTGDAAGYFADRETLFYTGSLLDIPSQTEAMAQQKNQDKWTVLPYPGTEKPTVVVSGLSYGVLKSTPAQELAAWLFIRWMTDPQKELQLLEAGGGLPVSSGAAQLAGSYGQTYPQWSKTIEWIPLAQAAPTVSDWRVARLVLGDAAWQSLQSYLPASQIPTILSQLDATIDEVAQAQK